MTNATTLRTLAPTNPKAKGQRSKIVDKYEMALRIVNDPCTAWILYNHIFGCISIELPPHLIGKLEDYRILIKEQ